MLFWLFFISSDAVPSVPKFHQYNPFIFILLHLLDQIQLVFHAFGAQEAFLATYFV